MVIKLDASLNAWSMSDSSAMGSLEDLRSAFGKAIRQMSVAMGLWNKDSNVTTEENQDA